MYIVAVHGCTQQFNAEALYCVCTSYVHICNTFTPQIKGKCHCINVILHWLRNVNEIYALILVRLVNLSVNEIYALISVHISR